jgi:site-specific DNA-methyltransferase (adenine-specific)
VQVKSGKVNAAHIRDLRGTVERDGAAIWAFITLEPPTKPMLKEAASAGFYVSPHFGKFPKLQILTVEDLLGGAALQYPHMSTSTFKKAARQRKTKETQPKLEGFTF